MAAKKSLRQLVETMGEKFEKIDEKLTSMDGRLVAMDGRLVAMDGRLDSVYFDVQEMKENMATKVDLNEVEQRLGAQIDGLYKKTSDQAEGQTMHISRFERVEDRVTVVEHTIGIAPTSAGA